jgi:carbon-monoxide dehydrogenase small subunit/xanthine dehydrogenase small subunit
MILAATPLKRGDGLDEIKTALAGNLCRCTGYPAIFRSVESVLKTPRRKSSRAGRR